MLQFGLDKLKQPGMGQLDALLRELPAVRPTTAHRLSLIAYQTDYGIFDHSSPEAQSRPLAVLAMHPKENVIEGGAERSHLRRFFNYRIGKQFNLSLDQFFDLPVDVVNFLYELVESQITQEPNADRLLRKKLDLDLDLDE